VVDGGEDVVFVVVDTGLEVDELVPVDTGFDVVVIDEPVYVEPISPHL
jgi:hypothetical protein